MIKNQLLHSSGVALFGRAYQTQLATLCNVQPRTIQRWLCYQLSAAHPAWIAISDALDARAREATALAEKIRDADLRIPPDSA